MRVFVLFITLILSCCTHIMATTPPQYRKYDGKQEEVNKLIDRYCVLRDVDSCEKILKALPYYKIAKLFEKNKIYADDNVKANRSCLVVREFLLNQWIIGCFINNMEGIKFGREEINLPANEHNDNSISYRFIENITLLNGTTKEITNVKKSNTTFWTENQCLISYAIAHIKNASDCIDNSNEYLTEIAKEIYIDNITSYGLMRNSFSFSDDEPTIPANGLNTIDKKEKFEKGYVAEFNEDFPRYKIKLTMSYTNYKGDAISSILPRYNGNRVNEYKFNGNFKQGSEDYIGRHLREEIAHEIGRVSDMIGRAVIKSAVGGPRLW